ncbi:unnamed protein product, partial [Pylaiella littoralis]
DKEVFWVDGLQPSGAEERTRAVFCVHVCAIAATAVRAGIGLGRGIYSIKELELALAVGRAPHESTKESKVPGYGVTWHDTTYDNWSLQVEGEGPNPHPYTGLSGGMHVGPDAIHETNHNEQCRLDYSGISTCAHISGVCATVAEQHNSKKPVYFRSVNTMGFANSPTRFV